MFTLVVNLFMLGFFKYYGFCIQSINTLFGLELPVRELALPIGISFYTFQALSARSMLTAWLGIVAYTMQIYFDFSGYSDMAIGMGKMFGFSFRENFNYPYSALSVTDFWRRWHISLSSWFRDYVYIPLGGNRCSVPRHLLNLMLVWLLTGLWHGAGWNFVLWGAYYGMLLIAEKYLLSGILERLPAVVKHGYTLCMVMIGWVFFSAPDMAHMMAYLGSLFGSTVQLRGIAGLVDASFWYYLISYAVLLILAGMCCTPWALW